MCDHIKYILKTTWFFNSRVKALHLEIRQWSLDGVMLWLAPLEQHLV